MRPVLLLTAVASVGLCGCMHTVIGWNSTSPDQQYRIRIVAHGASAKPFSATTKKRVYVSFLSNSTSNPAPLMEKKYVFAAADLRSTTTWRGSDEALIEFFDYPSSSSENLGAPSNHVASLLFRKGPAGRFTEVK